MFFLCLATCVLLRGAGPTAQPLAGPFICITLCLFSWWFFTDSIPWDSSPWKKNTMWGRSFMFFNQPPNRCKSKIMPAFFWLPPGIWSINTIWKSTWPGATRSNSCGYGSHLLLPRGTLWDSFCFVWRHKENWVVVSNIFHVHPYLGKIPILTNVFQRGWNHQPEKFDFFDWLVIFCYCIHLYTVYIYDMMQMFSVSCLFTCRETHLHVFLVFTLDRDCIIRANLKGISKKTTRMDYSLRWAKMLWLISHRPNKDWELSRSIFVFKIPEVSFHAFLS